MEQKHYNIDLNVTLFVEANLYNINLAIPNQLQHNCIKKDHLLTAH